MVEQRVRLRNLDDIDCADAVALSAYSLRRYVERDDDDETLLNQSVDHDYLAREALVAGLHGARYGDAEDWEEIALRAFIKERVGEDYDPERGDEIIDRYVRSLNAEIQTQAVLAGMPED